MQWHEYPLAFRAFAKALKLPNGPPRVMAKAVISHLKNSSAPPVQVANTLAQLDGEGVWVQNDRPYYDLYPSVAEAFTKIDLTKVKCAQLRLPIPELLVRMPVGKELALSSQAILRSFFVSETGVSKLSNTQAARGWLLSLDVARTMEIHGIACPVHTVVGVCMPDDGTIEESLEKGRVGPAYSNQVDGEAVRNAFRIVAALCLLSDDPDLIEPEPIEADRERWERTHDPALIDKATRRGKRCWAVGKHIEAAPGCRLPCFSIRWMRPKPGLVATDKPVNREHSRAHLLPVLRPVKGCLVRRREIQEVPTDWLGPECTDEAAGVHTAR